MEQHSKLKSEKPTLLRTRSELRCSWRVSSSCYAYGTGIVTHCLSHKKTSLVDWRSDSKGKRSIVTCDSIHCRDWSNGDGWS